MIIIHRYKKIKEYEVNNIDIYIQFQYSISKANWICIYEHIQCTWNKLFIFK